MTPRFDVDETFGDAYLHFSSASLGHEASEEDTDAVIARARLAPGMRVLDAPCGTGRIAARLAERGCAVTGVDRSTSYLELARRDAAARGVEVAYLEGDLRALPVDGPFDAVVCWFTSFGYFDDEENAAVLGEFRRVLAPGGVLVVDTLCHDAFVRSFTESPEGIVVDVDGDLMVDRTTFDVATGSFVCHRVMLRAGERTEAHFTVRLLTVPEWHHALTDAGFGAVEVTDPGGGPVDLSTWRHVVRAEA